MIRFGGIATPLAFGFFTLIWNDLIFIWFGLVRDWIHSNRESIMTEGMENSKKKINLFFDSFFLPSSILFAILHPY
jgi:hypothetical protein